MIEIIETQSTLTEYEQCPRSYYWRNIKCLSGRGLSYAMDVGTWFHYGMELFNDPVNRSIFGRDREKYLELFELQFYRKLEKPGYSENIKHHTECFEKAFPMLFGYLNNYELFDENIISPEITFAVKMKTPSGIYWELCGVLDLLYRINSKLNIRDYKTTSISEDRKTAYSFSKQMMLYTYATEKLTDEKVDFFEVDIINRSSQKRERGETEEEFQKKYIAACLKNKTGKSSLKRKTEMSQDEFINSQKQIYKNKKMFSRITIHPDRDLINEAVYEANLIADEIHDLKSNNAQREDWVKKTCHCFSFNRPCPYCELCNAGRHWNDLVGIYEKTEPHQELGENKIKSMVQSPI